MPDLIPQSILNKARQDKFIMVVDTAPVLKGLQSRSVRISPFVDLDKLQFSLVDCKIPPQSIPAASVAYSGQTMKVTGQTRDPYPAITATFAVDNNFANYWFLDQWLNMMNDSMDSGMDAHFALPENHVETGGVTTQIPTIIPKYKHIVTKNPHFDYQTTTTIFGLREYNEKVIRFDFTNCFVTNLGGIDYSYQKSDEVVCSFAMEFGRMKVSLVEPS